VAYHREEFHGDREKMSGVTAWDMKRIQEEAGILHKGCPIAGNMGSNPMHQTIRRTRLDSGGLHKKKFFEKIE